jgi:hypothetical protein
VRKAGILGTLAIFSHCYGLVLAALGFPFFCIDLVLGVANGSLVSPTGLSGHTASFLALVVLLSGSAALIYPWAVGAAHRGLWMKPIDLLLLPFYSTLGSCAAWRGLWELFREPAYWAKTEHGLSRSRRPRGTPVRTVSRVPERTGPAGAAG